MKKIGHIFKVRDHCHFTGEYRGAAYFECNLKCRKPLILSVIFRNLQGYDSHLFIKQLAKISGDLSCIPSTEEKYISFSKKIKVGEYFSRKMGKPFPIKFEIRFIDSFKFLQTSLANLVSNLQPTDFKNLNRVMKHNTSLLTRKGCYPYDLVSSIDILKETKLPSKGAYISFSKKIVVDEYFSRKMGKLFPKKLEIRFIDSFKFLQTSLANLVSNLQPSDLKTLNRVIKHNTTLLKGSLSL